MYLVTYQLRMCARCGDNEGKIKARYRVFRYRLHRCIGGVNCLTRQVYRLTRKRKHLPTRSVVDGRLNDRLRIFVPRLQARKRAARTAQQYVTKSMPPAPLGGTIDFCSLTCWNRAARQKSSKCKLHNTNMSDAFKSVSFTFDCPCSDYSIRG